MAFLGGLSGLGSLAGGISQGIPQGLNIENYLSGLQSQNLAGNVLSQAYGGQGQQPLSGLSNVVGGTGGGLAAGAGAQPISSQAPTPGLTPGQPAVASPPNLFGGGVPGLSSSAQPGVSTDPMNALATQGPLGSPQAQPPQAQPQAQAPSQQTPLSAPFQTNASQGIGGQGAQQQMTLPQFIQLARKVNPNASGRQIYGAATELAKGGLLGYGAMTPYQSAQLALEAGLHQAQIDNIHSEINNRADEGRHRVATEDRTAATETRRGAMDRMTIAGRSLDKAEKELADATNDLDKIRNTPEDNLTDDDKARAAALAPEISRLKAARNRAQRAYDASEKEYEGGGESASGGGGEAERTQDLANAKQYIQNGADKERVIAKLRSKYQDFDPAELGQ